METRWRAGRRAGYYLSRLHPLYKGCREKEIAGVVRRFFLDCGRVAARWEAKVVEIWVAYDGMSKARRKIPGMGTYRAQVDRSTTDSGFPAIGVRAVLGRGATRWRTVPMNHQAKYPAVQISLLICCELWNEGSFRLQVLADKRMPSGGGENPKIPGTRDGDTSD